MFSTNLDRAQIFLIFFLSYQDPSSFFKIFNFTFIPAIRAEDN
jgi:hypothetical protein